METRDDYKGVNYDDIIPFRAIHPGEILWEELKARRISRKAFAGQLGIERSVLTSLLKGRRDFTPDLAQRLEQALHIDSTLWTNLQAAYENDLRRIAERERQEAAPAAPIAMQYAV